VDGIVNRPALLVATALALTACGSPAPAPQPEPTICGTVADPVRVDDRLCANVGADGVADSPQGLVRWYSTTNLACLGPDDYTPVGEPLNDDYLGEPCDDDRHAVSKPKTTKAPTTRKPAETKRSKPTTRSTR
jgi:hypothetical protein